MRARDDWKADLGSLALTLGASLLWYFLAPKPRGNVTIIPPDEPVNLQLEGIWYGPDN